MIKGQIQSEVIEDVQAELDKSKDSTIKRTFTFDRNTDLGQIQIGDRYHACASSEDLRPPEGPECEKRVIKHFDQIFLAGSINISYLKYIYSFLIFHLSSFKFHTL